MIFNHNDSITLSSDNGVRIDYIKIQSEEVNACVTSFHFN